MTQLHTVMPSLSKSVGFKERLKTSLRLFLVSTQSLKVLRTSEFLPYVVFLQSPEFEVLKAMNHSAVEAEVVTQTLTVRHTCSSLSHLSSCLSKS